MFLTWCMCASNPYGWRCLYKKKQPKLNCEAIKPRVNEKRLMTIGNNDESEWESVNVHTMHHTSSKCVYVPSSRCVCSCAPWSGLLSGRSRRTCSHTRSSRRWKRRYNQTASAYGHRRWVFTRDSILKTDVITVSDNLLERAMWEYGLGMGGGGEWESSHLEHLEHSFHAQFLVLLRLPSAVAVDLLYARERVTHTHDH